jgi:protease PrsW
MTALSRDRRDALEQSGWGEDFHLVQPHNLAFWVYCLLIVAGLAVLQGQVSIAAAAYSGALTSGIIAFGLLAVAYLWFIHYEYRYTTVPDKLGAACIVWGFVGAIGAVALLGNDSEMSLYSKAFGASLAFD